MHCVAMCYNAEFSFLQLVQDSGETSGIVVPLVNIPLDKSLCGTGPHGKPTGPTHNTPTTGATKKPGIHACQCKLKVWPRQNIEGH